MYSVSFDDWTSVNKENGSISSQKYIFQGEKGDTLFFDWETSTEENCDKFVVCVDGEYVLTKSGETLGTFKWPVQSQGNHTVEFIYAKDFFSSAGKDEVIVKDIRVNSYSKSVTIDYSCNNDFNWWSSIYDKFEFNAGVDGWMKINYDFVSSSYSGSYKPGISCCINGSLVLYEEGFSLDKRARVKYLELPCGNNIVDIERSGYKSSDYSYYWFYRINTLSCSSIIPSVHKSLCVDSVPLNVCHPAVVSDLCFTRTYNNINWQALYVPFVLDLDELNDNFEIAKINNVNMYDTNDDGEIDETILEIIKVKRGTLKPNHPYLVKAKKAGTYTINLKDAMLYAKQDTVTTASAEMIFSFVGTTQGVSGDEMMDGHYYAMAGGELCYTDNNQASLKPYRWYMKVESRDSQVILPSKMANVKVRVVGEDVEATEIAEVETETESEVAPIYALDGRVVSKDGSKEGLRAGIYIKNGKKFIVK